MYTEGKMHTADCIPVVKFRLRVKCRLQTTEFLSKYCVIFIFDC